MKPSRKQRRFIIITALVDIVAIITSVVAAYSVRFNTGWIAFQGDAPALTDYLNPLLVVIPIYLYFFRAYGLYQTARYIRRIEEIFLVLKASTFAVILLMAGTFFYRDFSYSRIYLVTLWIVSMIVLSSTRYFMIQLEYRRKRAKKQITRILVIGANRNTRNIIKWAKNNPHYGREVVGVLAKEESLAEKHFEGVPILGTIEQCESFIKSVRPDEVILLDPTFSRPRTTDLVALCEDQFIEFRIGADFYGMMTRNVDVEYISSVPLLGFRRLALDDPWNRFVKRIFDLSVSLAMMIATLPIWVVAVVLIKLSDGGPIFYKQERMGRDQKIFNVLKFRTMKVGAEKETGPVWAQQNDNRKTWFGQFLRRWNIDELPQLLNVIFGDMSLVGPRPERPHFIEQFREEIPRYMARHKIKSGLTGWAQVSGYRGNTSIQERIKYDLYYMENWSLLFDIEIMFMTMFAFKNAY